MTAAITAAVVGSIGGALISKDASDSASKKNRKWQQRAVDEQTRQYDQTREDYAPWRETGSDAINRVCDLLSGDSSSFYKSPGYEFVRDEGTRNLENRFSAKGGGGNAMRALAEYNQNLASTEYGNFFGRNLSAAGMGQQAVGGTAMAGANAANNNSATYRGIGSDEASMDLYHGYNVANALTSGISNYLYGRKKPEELEELDPSLWDPKSPKPKRSVFGDIDYDGTGGDPGFGYRTPTTRRGYY